MARWQIFAVKLMSGFGLLVVLTTISHVDSWIVYSMGNNSIAVTQFRWDYWWLELALIVGIYAVAIPYGVLVSWFRWMGILAFIAANERYESSNFANMTVDKADVQVDAWRGTNNYYPLVLSLIHI